MNPSEIKITFCFDGNNLPSTHLPVVCVFRDNTEFYYEICTLVESVTKPEDKFWVQHNSLSKTRVYPHAWISLPNALPDEDFMKVLASKRQLTFELSVVH